MGNVYVPRKRKIELVSHHERGPISQSYQLDETSQVNGSFEDREIEEGEIFENGRPSPRMTSSRIGDRDVPKPATNGYPSASQGHHLCESCSSIDFNKIQPG